MIKFFNILIASLMVGVVKVRKHLSIVVVSVLIVAVDQFGGFEKVFAGDRPIDVLNAVLAVFKSWWMLGAAIGLVVFKGAIIVASTRDLLLAGIEGGADRVIFFIRGVISRNAAFNGIFGVIWYLIFFLLGACIIVVVSEFELQVYFEWAICYAFAVALFPVFYGGFSLIGFIFVIGDNEDGVALRGIFRSFLANARELYLLYAVRAVFEVVAIGVVIFLVPKIGLNRLVEIGCQVALMSVLVGVVRSTAMSFKLKIFGLGKTYEGFVRH